MAWISSRDQGFTRNFNEKLRASNLSILQARQTLESDLSAWERPEEQKLESLKANPPQREMAVLEAEENLRQAFWSGAVSATSSCGAKINEWHFGPDLPIAAHDTVAALIDGGIDEPLKYAEAHTGVRISELEVLARWPERYSDRLNIAGNPWWTLDQTAFWCLTRSHRGFDPTRNVDDDGFSAPDSVWRWSVKTLDEIRSHLRSGRIIAYAQRKHRGLQHAEARLEDAELLSKDFWLGHNFSDLAGVWFRRTEIIEVLPYVAPGDLESFSSRRLLIKALMEKGMTREEARTIAGNHPAGKPGRKPGQKTRRRKPTHSVSDCFRELLKKRNWANRNST